MALCLATSVLAQTVTYSDPALALAPRSVQETPATGSPLTPNYKEAVSGTPIEFGSFRLFPSLSVRYLRSTGLPQGPGTTVDTDINSITAELTAEIGTHWILNYSPSWVNYSEKSLSDSFNQSFLLNGATTTAVSEWKLALSEGFQSTNNVIAETAQQTKQTTWSTTVSAEHKVGQRSSYEGTAGMVDHHGEGFPDTRDWSTQHWMKMKMTEKTSVGLGVNLGYTEITDAADMDYVQYLGQFSWQSTEKIALSAQGGVETRHSMSASARDVSNPILRASLGYKPFEHTLITLTDFSNVSTSFYDNSITRNKGWNVDLNQRLLEKLQLDLSYSDQTSDYSAFGGGNASNPVNGRSDKVTSFNATLSVVVFKKWTLSAIYQSSKDASNLAGFDFSTTQYGVELRGRF